MRVQEGVEEVELYFFNLGASWGGGGWSTTHCLFFRRLGGPQGRSGLVREVSPLPEFDSRTVQPGYTIPVYQQNNEYRELYEG
jgi:hypothetical protein